MDTNKIKEVSSVFYDTLLLDNLIDRFAKHIKESIIRTSSDITEIDLNKLTEEIRILGFEVFCLNFIHHFGIDLSVPQSFFTKDYLFSKDRKSIWDGMEIYNKAISHSVNVYSPTSDSLEPQMYSRIMKSKSEYGKSLIHSIAPIMISHPNYNNFLVAGYDIGSNDRGYIFPLKYPGRMSLFGDMSYMPGFHYASRITLADKYINIYGVGDLDLNNKANAQSIARVINRVDSKKVWKKGITSYYLALALFGRLGFGSGPDYTGPNKDTQSMVKDFITNMYNLSEEAWAGVSM